jgi:succinate-semialdehyde dehydrogenase / glutarate-semialdehyde dehydrogenase
MYPEVSLHIGGSDCQGARGETLPVSNPATEEVIGACPRAEREDLDRSLASAAEGFATWRKVPAFERAKLMRKAADLLRARADKIAPIMTLEQGKPVAEAKGEVIGSADMIDWFAEEARRTYGRVIPARSLGVQQHVVKEPVGPVAAFTPWNFPIAQAVRKVGAALAAGCSIILKGPEETPASCASLVQAFADAGLPPGVLNLVFGIPGDISAYLIPHPTIRKVSFTGSVPVGKYLASLAGQHMKRVTMELGGHAPAIVFGDADVDTAARILAANKFRNAGQICVAPTRFLVQESLVEPFTEQFVSAARALKVGNGLEAGVQMGPLATARRVEAIEGFVSDAVNRGAIVRTGESASATRATFLSRRSSRMSPSTRRS